MHALPMKFHMAKSLLSTNLLMPFIFLTINLTVTILLLNIVANVKTDTILNMMGVMLIPFSILSVTFYLLSAYTNPGLLIGNEQVQLQKAQDWNYKHQEQLQ